MYGSAAVSSTEMNWICPLMRSARAGPEPLYGTCTAWMPDIDLNSSAARWCGEPLPAEP